MDSAPAIGIDLGTTYSCAAAFRHDKSEIIKTELGLGTMASCVSYTKKGRLIGDNAKDNTLLDPTSTITGVKRFIGRQYNDRILQQDINNYPFEIIDDNGRPKVKVYFKGEDKLFSPEEISATILEKIKDNAESHFGKEVRAAVITVPAHFNDSQRQATKDAGRIAGLEVLRIINEPTAAALAYGIHEKYRNNNESCNILVYDFGGGTFDVSIISIDDGIFEVKATTGDTYLGGDDIDLLLVNHFIKEFQTKYNLNLDVDKRAVRRLRLQCEKVKRILSSAQQASISIDVLYQGHDFYSGITRKQLEDLCHGVFECTIQLVEEALKDAAMDKADIDEVVLVGGTTRIPKVQELISKFFNGKELNMSLNPDEAVAIGAAVQAAILEGKQNDSEIIGSLLVTDVNSLSLGIETVGGFMNVIIPRNTQIPTKIEKRYETVFDNQTGVQIEVYEGERKLTSRNSVLGQFKLNGIEPARRGKAKINVTFDINTDCILNVSAVETKGKITNALNIHIDKHRLSEEEIQRMIAEAVKFKREDEKWATIIQARLNLEQYCCDTKTRVNIDFAKQMTQEHKTIITLKCNEALKWLNKNQDQPKEEYESKKKEVYNVCQSIIKRYI
ncbi:Heat shock protein 70 cognate 4 [Carabus blaptoides fortunei]